jgi:hypothetical protein
MKLLEELGGADLGTKDVVVVFKEDGSEELYIPNIGDDEEIGVPGEKGLMVAMLFSEKPQAEEARKLLLELAAKITDNE